MRPFWQSSLFSSSRIPLRLCFFLLSALLALGNTASADPPVILCLGDSLTAGQGVSREESYPGLLEKRLRERGHPHRVINAGVSGDTSAGVWRRLDWTLRSNPSLVILVIGANDGLRGLPLDQMESNIDHILARLQEKKIRVILGGMQIPPNYGDTYTRSFAEIYPRLAKKHAIHLLPFFLDGVAGQPALNQPDGIHPNPQGYRIILNTMWPVLERLLSGQPNP
ncbi:MAG: arylesterase [Magnetococcales bacterium]|nr:arylesterase [Magnetococcales bacterium]